jgi:hypothetical protein
MCLEASLFLLLYEYCTAGSLSQYILSGFSMLSTTLTSGPNFLSYSAYLVASKQATNSAYIVDDIMIVCLELFHYMTPFVSVNIYPDVNFSVSKQPAKSESE